MASIRTKAQKRQHMHLRLKENLILLGVLVVIGLWVLFNG